MAGSVIDVAALATEEGSETGSTTGEGTAVVDSELAEIVTGREDSGETGKAVSGLEGIAKGALGLPGSERGDLGTGTDRTDPKKDGEWCECLCVGKC